MNKLYYYLKTLDILMQGRDILSPAGLTKYEKRTLNELKRKLKDLNNKALKQIVRILEGVDFNNDFSVEAGIDRIKIIITAHGIDISEDAEKVLRENSSLVYRTVKEAQSIRFFDKTELNQLDQEAIERINKNSGLFIQEYYRDKTTEKVENVIRAALKGQQFITPELKNKIILDLDNRFPQYIGVGNYFEVVVTQILNSSRSYANLKLFREKGVQKYVVVAIIDDRTTLQCMFMNKRKLSVSVGLRKFEELDNAQTLEDKKNIMPWLFDAKGDIYFGDRFLENDISDYELDLIGVSTPPYHAKCRTTIYPDI